jgi:O-antigen/teichoic acid export membrane protein
MVGVMVILLSLTYVLAPFAVQFLLGSSYSGSVVVLRIFCVVMLASSISQPLVLFLLAKGYDHYVASVVLTGAVLGLAAVGAGAGLGRAEGAALGVGVMQIYLLAFLAAKTISVTRARASLLRSTRT